MCDIMMTRDEKMRLMVKKHFTPDDYFAVRDHMIGTGMIGGTFAHNMLLIQDLSVPRCLQDYIYKVLHGFGHCHV
ncbi:hypothetical protein SAMN05216356_10936 [Oribacterium sp. WCC10]|nr:hypothetical protein SAMN05216356_10936 [Oribacterium sp. WCC10]